MLLGGCEWFADAVVSVLCELASSVIRVLSSLSSSVIRIRSWSSYTIISIMSGLSGAVVGASRSLRGLVVRIVQAVGDTGERGWPGMEKNVRVVEVSLKKKKIVSTKDTQITRNKQKLNNGFYSSH